ncbi:PepSY domain-containing protein [Caulobacter segnis]|uniref:PepSY domain-containing protein n=1 Tax=Caulobacter segnis TaxID=88688 RepID=UPI001CBE71F5|nr:PepSY domain-containing protein [Caulobacter segnis]UAL12374.1 PepSY domain-containing protein [Caulobacter segnis]
MILSRHPFRTLLIAAAAISTLAAVGARADDHKKQNHEAARQALLRKEVLPLTRILAIAAQRAPGEVIEVELEQGDHGRLKYDLKILAKNGRVRELELDAKTGATLKLEDD